MIEGHPIFIANSGRMGFDTNDYLEYSPEAAKPLPLFWLAAHKSRCDVSLGDSLTYESLIESELDATDRDRFERSLTSQGVNPDAYYYLPVHPWQWTNKIQQLYTEDLVDQSLIYLGESTDKFQPQQSIRTFFNQSHYGKRYIKVALSITNMGFVRGLSADYMAVTPAINDYINQLLANDPVISRLPFAILKEDAALGYRQPTFNQGELKDASFRKMLACLYRENPLNQIESHQQLKTMASLLQVDFDGKALLPEIINASGLGIERWLESYFSVYLTPLLHCFYRHKLVFMPHGENLILVFDNHVPVKAFMKDIGEEVCLLNVNPDGLPEAVKRIAITLPADQELLSIFTDVFDDFFRFISVILYQHMAFSDQYFWQAVANHINAFQQVNPDIAPLFKQHDLFIDAFDHSCLNRLQLGNNKQMVDLTDPAGSLQFAGKIVNPIAKFR
jgi:siderophore synthetase component